MKPVMSANILAGHAALRASSTWPRYSTMAASTGVGLFQCVKPQAAQRKRSTMPLSSCIGSISSGFAHWGQKFQRVICFCFDSCSRLSVTASGCFY